MKTQVHKQPKKTPPMRVIMEYPYKGTFSKAKIRKAVEKVINARTSK